MFRALLEYGEKIKQDIQNYLTYKKKNDRPRV
jgi:hypothetical protein